MWKPRGSADISGGHLPSELCVGDPFGIITNITRDSDITIDDAWLDKRIKAASNSSRIAYSCQLEKSIKQAGAELCQALAMLP